MNEIRIIPCLDIKDGRVVKGVKFVDLKDALDPSAAALAYSRDKADELVFLDIAATAENRATNLEWVRAVRKKTTIPFTVGGGISGLRHKMGLCMDRAARRAGRRRKTRARLRAEGCRSDL